MAAELPSLHLKHLEEQLAELSDRVGRLESTNGSVSSKTVEVRTFAPEPYQLSSPISVTVEEDAAGSFVASFFDANISTTGENEQEAFENLKSLILDVFDSLNREAPAKLGPEPRRQLAVLRRFLSAA
jgi:predicted RNase H-like HicB family nuclease